MTTEDKIDQLEFVLKMGAPIPNFIELEERISKMQLARILNLLLDYKIITIIYTERESSFCASPFKASKIVATSLERMMSILDLSQIKLNNSPIIQFAMQFHFIVKENPHVHFRIDEIDYQNVADLKIRVCKNEQRNIFID